MPVWKRQKVLDHSSWPRLPRYCTVRSKIPPLLLCLDLHSSFRHVPFSISYSCRSYSTSYYCAWNFWCLLKSQKLQGLWSDMFCLTREWVKTSTIFRRKFTSIHSQSVFGVAFEQLIPSHGHRPPCSFDAWQGQLSDAQCDPLFIHL